MFRRARPKSFCKHSFDKLSSFLVVALNFSMQCILEDNIDRIFQNQSNPQNSISDGCKGRLLDISYRIPSGNWRVVCWGTAFWVGFGNHGLPRWLGGKNLPASAGDAGDLGLIPGLGRFPGGGNGSPLQYSCLENPMDRGVWWATALGVIKNWTRLSMHACIHAWKSWLENININDVIFSVDFIEFSVVIPSTQYPEATRSWKIDIASDPTIVSSIALANKAEDFFLGNCQLDIMRSIPGKDEIQAFKRHHHCIYGAWVWANEMPVKE